MDIYIYDLETLPNCFLAVFIHIKDKEKNKKFIISEYQNDTKEYITFLKQRTKDTLLVSFNGLKFDAQVNTFILQNKKQLLLKESSYVIYKYAQSVIRKSNNKEKLDYPVTKLLFYECDLLALNNYDNPAKRASLKWLQYNMNWPTLLDMEFEHNKPIRKEDIPALIKYCINDCLSTRQLYLKNIQEIKLRIKLSKVYNKNLISFSEPKLSKTIFSFYLSKALNISEYELSSLQTNRNEIHIKDIILPYIKYTTPLFNDTKNKFLSQTINAHNLKGSFSEEIVYKGMPITFALGGIHGAKPGIYESDNTYIIKSYDVKSYYPNLAIKNHWSPKHLPKKEFCELYENLYNERATYPKSNPLNYVLKIVLNSAYGLSNDKHSFLRDTFYTMLITINGQLLLCMLLEKLCEKIPGARPIMINTDGAEIIIPKQYEELYDRICSKWEEITQLELEYEKYQKIIIGDVNNYIGIYEPVEITKEQYDKKILEYPLPKVYSNNDLYYECKTKLKGRFEINKALHKNNSYRIKRIALYNYFVHNKSIDDSLKENKNIFDFLAGVRVNKGWKFYQTCIQEGDVIDETLQKTIRYFIGKKGCKILKVNPTDNKVIKIEAQNCFEYVLLNYDKQRNFNSYPIDFSYYSKAIRKEIEQLEPSYKQNKLF